MAVLFFTLRFFPSNVWNRISAFEEIGEEEILGIRQGETVSLTGTIVSCQTKQQGKETITELILNHITFISPIQNHSTNQIDSNFKIKCYLNEEETVKITFYDSDPESGNKKEKALGDSIEVKKGDSIDSSEEI